MQKSKLVKIYETKSETVDQILLALGVDAEVETLARDLVLDFDFVFCAMSNNKLTIQEAVQQLQQSKQTSVTAQMSEAELNQLQQEIEATSAQRNRLIVADEMINVEGQLRRFTAAAYQSALVKDLTSGKQLSDLLPPLQTVEVEVQEITGHSPKALPDESSSKSS